MDPKEFPSLAEASITSPGVNNDNTEKSNMLGSSWAEVAQPHSDKESQEESVGEQEHQIPQPTTVDHSPNAWEATKQNASFADIAGHEKKQQEEFPTPQESIKQVDNGTVPSTGGVGELLQKKTKIETAEDPTAPPNPDRSFAAVTSNEGFPKPEHDTVATTSDEPHLSDLPDVKDMLDQPSVHIPPVPPSQSFAKMAAKEIPPEKKPLSERAQYIINHQPKEEEPLAMSHENFPTLGQSNLMAQENASDEDRAVYAEIGRFNEVNKDDKETKENRDPTLAKSFADITSSNMENAPPAAKSHVDQHPVYDEETVYLENAKREERKNHQAPSGNNEQLTQEEELKEVKPTKEQYEQEVEKDQIQGKSRGMTSKDKDVTTHYGAFDANQSGKITIFHTMAALYRLGYSWISIIPGALLMHIRLSPLTSPYRAPFIYRSLSDLILLPIYTENLNQALTYKTPMLHQKKEEVDKMVKTFGHKQGLGYWDGLKALRSFEKDSLKWWQFSLWTIHRIQWTLTYTMLHEPKTNVVTASTLSYLGSND